MRDQEDAIARNRWIVSDITYEKLDLDEDALDSSNWRVNMIVVKLTV